METLINDLGLFKYFAPVKMLVREIQRLENDLSLSQSANAELREELRKERQIGLDNLRKVIDSFTAVKKPSEAEVFNPYLRFEGETEEQYQKRLISYHKPVNFRGHNEIIDQAYEDELKVAEKMHEDEEAKRRKESSIIVGANKQRELIKKAKAIVEARNNG